MSRFFRIRWWLKPSGERKTTDTDTFSSVDEITEDRGMEILDELAGGHRHTFNVGTNFEDATLIGSATENFGVIKVTELRHPPKDESDVVDADSLMGWGKEVE